MRTVIIPCVCRLSGRHHTNVIQAQVSSSWEVSRKGGIRFDFIGSITQMCYYLFFREYRTKCAITCFVFWGSIAQNVLLRISCFGKYCTKCVLASFVFWGCIAQMCYYVFRVLGSIAQNVLLRVSCFGEVSHKMCSHVFCVLGKYCTKCALTCFGEVLHKCRKYFVFLGCITKMLDVYWYSTAQMWHTSSAPAKLKYSTCLTFLGNIAKIQHTFRVPSKYH
jgi:hypothetical protein